MVVVQLVPTIVSFMIRYIRLTPIAVGMAKEPTAVLEIDGACSGNPGPAGYGVVLYVQDDVFTEKGSIGDATNNRAEYRALIAGLRFAGNRDVEDLTVKSDSELLVYQMTGKYRVKNQRLRELHQEAVDVAGRFRTVDFECVPRDQIKQADQLARVARDG